RFSRDWSSDVCSSDLFSTSRKRVRVRMAMRGMLRSLGTKASAGLRVNEAAAVPIDVNQRLALLDAFEEEGIGWFWVTDGDGRIRSEGRRGGKGRPARR